MSWLSLLYLHHLSVKKMNTFLFFIYFLVKINNFFVVLWISFKHFIFLSDSSCFLLDLRERLLQFYELFIGSRVLFDLLKHCVINLFFLHVICNLKLFIRRRDVGHLDYGLLYTLLCFCCSILRRLIWLGLGRLI